jgi:hypothetical protein
MRRPHNMPNLKLIMSHLEKTYTSLLWSVLFLRAGWRVKPFEREALESI